MATRAALPSDAVTVTPGYSWRIDLDILFDGVRPDDWTQWRVRMHVWGEGVSMSLTDGDGVRFDYIDAISEGNGLVLVPVIEMTAEKTSLLRGKSGLHYLIDIAAPDGEPEDYFSGSLNLLYAPPAELLR